MSDITDPIDGLIRYVNEIKPYHSKVIEVLTEYVYEEELNVTMSDSTLMDVGIVIDRIDTESNLDIAKYGGTYDGGPYDSSLYFPVISINTTLPDGAFTVPAPGELDKKGYNADFNRVTLPGDQTATYRPGRNVIVDLVQHDKITGEDGAPISNTYQIITSTYVTNGQTNGISDTPHTTLILSGLVDETDPVLTSTLGPDEVWSASVRLVSVTVNSVVVGNSPASNTGRIRYSTVPLLGPGTLETAPYTPPASTSYGDGNITNLDNYIVLDGDTTDAYPYGSTLIMLLANGDTNQYTVASSYFDGTNTNISVLQELDVAADYIGAEVVEGFFGYSDAYVLPTNNTSIIPEGLTQTNISESITFSWNDGTDEVIDFHQFQIAETQAGNKIILVSDGRDVNDYISVGDTINIIEQETGNNGQHVVSSINGNEVVVSSSLNISDDTGFLETT